MISISIWKFEKPIEVLLYINYKWGRCGTRWDLKNLEDLELANDSDLTFLLLKFNVKEL